MVNFAVKWWYTLTVISTIKIGVNFYTKKIEKTNIALMVADDIYNLSMRQDNGKEYTIASRYKVQSQEELNFLIFNERAGSYFK